jgi:hypothetical protein
LAKIQYDNRIGSAFFKYLYQSYWAHELLEEVAPYHIYADRVVILHNPIETGDKHMRVRDRGFCNPRTGICYLRTAFIAANYGPSGIYIGYFLYPENGHIMELPTQKI